jgi:hypothetical protein
MLCSHLERIGARVVCRELPPPPPPKPCVIPEAWHDAPWMVELDAQGYLEAIEEGMARTRDEEIFLRLRTFWCDNDPFRRDEAAWVPFADRGAAARENLERLYALLSLDTTDDASQSRLLRAETARQLGRFAEAIAILDRDVEEQLRPAAEKIAACARHGEDALVLLFSV